MNERQIEKCQICNENEYTARVIFKYKKKQITERACDKCIEFLMTNEFSRFRTVEYREDVKVKRRK